ncbi:MAG: TPM domain-containing protein [Muribaculaceae bacterium]|nr:TPM domain-containing protein [Muribaculaceae bacterium]
MIKRLLPILLIIFTAAFAAAATYSVDKVPNVHLADSTRFVSNPDGILSPEAEAQANALLRRLMRETSAEVACVVVDDIDGEPDDFATDLFRRWGIGKKDNNNGVLVLIAKDRRRAVIRTGTGVEGLLPDGLCGSIIRANMIPNFRREDYDSGTLGALADIAGILSTPEARAEVMSKYANNAGSDDDFDGDAAFKAYLILCVFLTVAGLTLVVYKIIKTAGMPRQQKYVEFHKIQLMLLIDSFVGLGMPLIAYLIVYFICKRLRRGKHLCATCGKPMKLIDEERDNDFLTREQDIEERVGSVDYDVWRCPADGTTEIIPYVQLDSAFAECPVCHARTFHVVSDRITRQPSTTHTGTRVVTRQCVSCGFE